MRPLAVVALAFAVLASGGCHIGARRDDSAKQQQAYANEMRYTVVAGDTLSNVAARYQIPVERIVDANQLREPTLYLGQVLILPGARPLPPPPPPVVKTEKVEPPPDAPLGIPRSAWARQKIDGGNIQPMGMKPYRITVHHSADDLAENASDPAEVLRDIEKQHKLGAGKNEPFACIGYHFVISADGRIWEGRPLRFQGAHATGDNNRGNIGVCLLGNFDKHSVPAAQREALIRLLDELCSRYGIEPGPETVVGHRHFKSTDCPGRALEPIVVAYSRGNVRDSRFARR